MKYLQKKFIIVTRNDFMSQQLNSCQKKAILVILVNLILDFVGAWLPGSSQTLLVARNDLFMHFFQRSISSQIDNCYIKQILGKGIKFLSQEINCCQRN